MKNKFFDSSTKYVIAICVVLLAITIGICVFLNISLRNKVRNIVYQSMSNVSDTSSALIDGDKFKTINEETSKDDPIYQEVLQLLTVFKEQNDFVYIYTIKLTDDGKYIFVIDQDPEEPASYGDEIVYTQAMEKCLKENVTAIDKEASNDKWGSFYTTFTPITDSDGNVVGAVGIDFDSTWYEEQISGHSMYFAIVFVVAITGGIAISFILMSQLLQRFRTLNRGLSVLSKDIDALTTEINEKQNKSKDEIVTYEGRNEIEEITFKMNSMSNELKKYIDYVHNQAFLDTMTGASSKVAYYEYLQRLEDKIVNDIADFKIIVFDLNGLKKINDNYGHECGDDFIINSAKVIVDLFGKEQTFRIGGDEFIVILENDNRSIDEINELIYQKEVEFNQNIDKNQIPVSFSFGASSYEKNGDTYKQVFKRADEIMYQYKNLYYKNLYGDKGDKHNFE